MSSPSFAQRVVPASRGWRPIAVAVLLVAVHVMVLAHAHAADTPDDGDDADRTPPRVSFVDGQVSFARPGGEEWVAARLNTPLAPGDELYTGSPGNLEIEIGPRAYVRAWASTQLGLANLEPDFVQFRVTTGTIALDVRRLDPGHTIEIDTPNAAFTIERPGFYRVTVTETRTSLVTRRGGRATVTPANGTAAAIAPSEEVIVEGLDSPQVMTYAAPQLDAWDRWNYARTDALIESVSARYVSPGVYGVPDLDYHGSWRVVETYGPVWVPTAVPAGWAPYTTGRWLWDPYYGWTWIDTAPWGWAPYHHGRWVFVTGFWGWAPGPIVARPVYAPALVVFLGPRVGVTIGVGVPPVGWVALGWGEPVVPWWGRPSYIGTPRWVGWGGPRIVNNVVIQKTTIVRVEEIKVYRNVTVKNAIVAVPRDQFAKGPVPRGHAAQVDPSHFQPVHGKVDVAPVRASLAPDSVRGARPPEATLRRSVVATRAPDNPDRWLESHGIAEKAKGAPPAARIVPPPAKGGDAEGPPRPRFGDSKKERPQPAQPPRPGRAQPPSARVTPEGKAPRQAPAPGPAAATPPAATPPPTSTTPPASTTPPTSATPATKGSPPPHAPGAPPPPSTGPATKGGTPPPPSGAAPRPAPAPGGESRPGVAAPGARPPAGAPKAHAEGKAGEGTSRTQVPSGKQPAGKGARPEERKLPGEPANRLAPER